MVSRFGQHVAVQALAAILDIPVDGLSRSLRIAIAQRADDPKMRVRIPVRHPGIVQVRKDRSAAHPQVFDDVEQNGQTGDAAKREVKLCVQVDRFVEGFALVASRDVDVDRFKGIDVGGCGADRRRCGGAAFQIEAYAANLLKLRVGEGGHHHRPPAIQCKRLDRHEA